MAFKPAALDHVNIYVRNAERSHRWYTEIFGFHTQDMAYVPETGKLRAAFLACDANHAHDIALFDVGEDAQGPQKGQVGLNHVAWRMESLDDLAEMYERLKAKGVAVHVADHTVSLGRVLLRPRRQRPRGVLRAAAESVEAGAAVHGCDAGGEGSLPGSVGRGAAADGARRDSSLTARPSGARRRRGVTRRSTMSSAPTNAASEPIASPTPASIAS